MASSKQKMSHEFNDAHPELKRKWRQLFHFLVGNRTGNLTMKRVEQFQHEFLSHKDIPQDKRTRAAGMFQDLLTDMLGAEQSVTCEQFVAQKTKLQNFHAGTHSVGIKRLYTRMFNCVDFSGDGKITVREFLKFSEATGFTDRAAIERAFHAIDVNGNGYISCDEFTEAYVKYGMDAAVKQFLVFHKWKHL